MEEAREEEVQKLEEVWTTANDSNGNEMNLSSELTRTYTLRLFDILPALLCVSTIHNDFFNSFAQYE